MYRQIEEPSNSVVNILLLSGCQTFSGVLGCVVLELLKVEAFLFTFWVVGCGLWVLCAVDLPLCSCLLCQLYCLVPCRAVQSGCSAGPAECRLVW